MKSHIHTTLSSFINESSLIANNLILYRGEEKEYLKPTDNSYSFFAEKKSVAEDYGDYVWECKFGSMNLFISYKKESIYELYNNGFKLRDNYIEDNWGKKGTCYDEVCDLYDYDSNSRDYDNFGYKSAEDAIKSPFFGSDTWEVIEHTDGVLNYILSKYDGVILLEGGDRTYYLDTSKMIDCTII